MRLRSLLLVLFLLPLVSLRAQGFFRTYGSAGINEGGLVMIPSPDGNLFAGGYRNDSALIMKMDLLGNILWAKTFRPVLAAGYVNYVYDLEITPDNYLIGAGHAIFPTPFDEKGFYFKFDLNGNMQWSHFINDSRRTYCQRIFPLSSLQYILVGDIYDLASATSADVVTAHIDASNGNMTWLSPRFNFMQTNAFIDDVGSAVTGRNNAIYSTGRIYVNGAANNSMRPYLAKFDNSGNFLFANYLVYTAAMSGRIYGEDLIYDNDSAVIAYMGDINGASNNYTIGLIKTDTLGNVAWSKNYDLPASPTEVSTKVVRFASGYLVYGYTSNNNAAVTVRDLVLMATDLNGNLLWTKKYGGANTGEFVRSPGTPSALCLGNTIYLVGQQDNGSGTTDLLVIATDLNGDIVCQPPGTISPVVTPNPTFTTACVPTFPTDALLLGTPSGTATFVFDDPCSTYAVHLGNDTTVCNPLTLNGTIAGATSYEWQDGSSLPTFNATTAGTYWVTVHINCCAVSDTIVLSPGAPPAAQFSSAVPPCIGQPVVFSNNSAGATSYSWDFGDNTTSSLANPSHVYAGAGTYTVMLVAANGCGSDTIQQTVTIPPSPVVQVALENEQGCGPLTVTFYDLTAPAGSVTAWSWNFGDGHTSTQQQPQHTFTSPGSYNVSLTVTTTAGCQVTAAGASVVTVFPDPTAAFTSQPLETDQPTVQFTDHSSGAVQWQWYFGDGDSSAVTSPQHEYTFSGNYPVTLVVTNSYGCMDTAVVMAEAVTEFTFYIPNAFTPNGNGNNEGFTGYGTGIATFHMMIFDRWGMLLYDTSSLQAPWDGTFRGRPVQEDVYVYKIDVTDVFFQPHFYIGHVTVVR